MMQQLYQRLYRYVQQKKSHYLYIPNLCLQQKLLVHCCINGLHVLYDDNVFLYFLNPRYQQLLKERSGDASSTDGGEGDQTAAFAAMAQPPSNEPNSQAEFFLDMVTAYMRIVQTTLRDLIPKSVVYCLIRKTVREYMERSGHFLGDVLKVEDGEAGDDEVAVVDKSERREEELEKLASRNDATRERIEQVNFHLKYACEVICIRKSQLPCRFQALRRRDELMRAQRIVLDTSDMDDI